MTHQEYLPAISVSVSSYRIRALDRLNPAIEILLVNLKLLAERNFPALVKLCAMSIIEINDIAEQIKTWTQNQASYLIKK